MMTEDRELLKQKRRRKEYYKAGSSKALDQRGQLENDAWDRSLGFVEGITQPQGTDEKPIKVIEGCAWFDLDSDGVPEKYLVKYEPEAKALLSLAPHILRRGIDASVVFKMVKREHRLDGVSLIGDAEDLFNQIDFNVRHRNNVRILTTSPIFLAQS